MRGVGRTVGAAAVALVSIAFLALCGYAASALLPGASPETREAITSDALPQHAGSLPSVAGVLLSEATYDEVSEGLGGVPVTLSCDGWQGVTIRLGREEEDVTKMTATFWASGFELIGSGQGHGLPETTVPSFFVIENGGRLEKRSNEYGARTMELRANGSEFGVEADLGSTSLVDVGPYSYPAIDARQAAEIEAMCLDSGGSRALIDGFDESDVADMVAGFGVADGGLTETGSARYCVPIEDALAEIQDGLAVLAQNPAQAGSGLVVASSSFSCGYRWTGFFTAGETPVSVEVDASNSVHVVLQSAGEQDPLALSQYRFSPQGQSVTVTFSL